MAVVSCFVFGVMLIQIPLNFVKLSFLLYVFFFYLFFFKWLVLRQTVFQTKRRMLYCVLWTGFLIKHNFVPERV